MKEDLIAAGKIVNTHGIQGELKIQPWADSPDFLTGFDRYYIDGKPVKVISAKVHKGHVLTAVEGIDGIDAAIRMKNKVIMVRKDDVDLGEDRYFIEDLKGLQVLDAETGGKLGILSDVLTLPAHNVYVIKGEREILIPALPEFIVKTDIHNGYIKVKLLEGL